jgi:hypothetical protein
MFVARTLLLTAVIITAEFAFEKVDYLNGKHLIVATADV